MRLIETILYVRRLEVETKYIILTYRGEIQVLIKYALNYDKLPDQLLTVFAGQDKEATEHVREKAPEYLPSSPSFALFKDGKIVDMIERHEIEGHETMSVITNLQAWFEEHGKEI